MKFAAILTCAVLFTACGESSFTGGASKVSPKGKNTAGSADGSNGGASTVDGLNNGGTGGAGGNGNADGSGGAGGNGNNGNDGGAGGSGNTGPIFDGNTGATPPKDCSNEQILIIDLKSGWWAGDGGSTFQQFVRDEIEKNSCEGGVVSVEYHHILMMDPRLKPGKKFYDKDFKTYTQVWLLSGSLEDAADIRIEEANFQEFIQQVKTHKPGLFLGAGFGSSDHSNELSRKILWGSDIFKVEIKHGDILTVKQNNVKIVSYAKQLVTGNLFAGLSGAIVDVVKVGGEDAWNPEKTAGADEIIKLSGVTPLATCVTVDQSRTVPCVAVAKYNSFNMVLDSGMPRFYSIQAGNEPTKQYFRNIVRALSK